MCGLDKTEIVLTGPFKSKLHWYKVLISEVWFTKVSLCIDPLYKASFLDSLESKEGAYCTISEGSDQNVLLQSHCLSCFGQPGYRG